MNALDSPLEALAFNYLSYGVLTAVNSIWPLVAVLTAAVSFWRIRALSSSKWVPRGRSTDCASTSLSPVDEDVTAADAEVASTSSQFNTYLSGSNTKFRVLERQGTTKGKFTLYYDKDESRTGEGDDNGGRNDDGATANEKLGLCCDDWESMMVMKIGGMGWYQYQDLTVLDGSVVRLWDSRWQRNAAAVGGVTW
ncbi:unnamed protein product [Fraxinus pennsylvanica]|uniref:Uncharacterized protein n=1 Tax=Fraxinus pennsylvanica TaxID=56036 RepID=A0AAD2EAA5_9LAMI|nr:unnamed protein product [Fraxinus pennsylvanica]